MCILSLNERAQVVHQAIKSCPSHTEDVVKHVRGIDIEEVFIKPACGAWFHVSLGIRYMNVPSKEVKEVSGMWVLKFVLFRPMSCECVGGLANAMLFAPFSFFPFFLQVVLCFPRLMLCTCA